MNAQEMATEGARLSKLLDDALNYVGRQVKEAAEAEREYRKDKALAWLQAPSGTVPEREAWVNGQTADQRFRRDLADGMRRAGMEAVHSRRQQISLLQSVANAYKAEAEFIGRAPLEMVGP